MQGLLTNRILKNLNVLLGGSGKSNNFSNAVRQIVRNEVQMLSIRKYPVNVATKMNAT